MSEKDKHTEVKVVQRRKFPEHFHCFYQSFQILPSIPLDTSHSRYFLSESCIKHPCLMLQHAINKILWSVMAHTYAEKSLVLRESSLLYIHKNMTVEAFLSCLLGILRHYRIHHQCFILPIGIFLFTL